MDRSKEVGPSGKDCRYTSLLCLSRSNKVSEERSFLCFVREVYKTVKGYLSIFRIKTKELRENLFVVFSSFLSNSRCLTHQR